MSQLFNVVQCFDCSKYQVDIHKRSINKWSCKMCGLKQSLKQIFYQGDSKDCRERVKALGDLKYQQEIENDKTKLKNQFKSESIQMKSAERVDTSNFQGYGQEVLIDGDKKISKWDKYLTNSDDENIYY